MAAGARAANARGAWQAQRWGPAADLGDDRAAFCHGNEPHRVFSGADFRAAAAHWSGPRARAGTAPAAHRHRHKPPARMARDREKNFSDHSRVRPKWDEGVHRRPLAACAILAINRPDGQACRSRSARAFLLASPPSAWHRSFRGRTKRLTKIISAAQQKRERKFHDCLCVEQNIDEDLSEVSAHRFCVNESARRIHFGYFVSLILLRRIQCVDLFDMYRF